MNKGIVKITESDLNRIIKESVNKVISESELNNDFNIHDAVFQMRDLQRRLRTTLNEFINRDNEVIHKIQHQLTLRDGKLSSQFLDIFYQIDEGIDGLADIANDAELISMK